MVLHYLIKDLPWGETPVFLESKRRQFRGEKCEKPFCEYLACPRFEGVVIRGKIDVLVLQDQFWIIVIESKRAKFSLEPRIPQALAYMLANPNPEKPLFGLVTNGSNFIFLKLVKQEVPYYALSDEFTLRRGNDLYSVLGILKRLGQLLIKG